MKHFCITLIFAVVMEIAEAIVRFCGEPHTFEEILQQLFEVYGLTMTYEQHVLVGSTVRSYLSWLKESGRLEIGFENNRQVWKQM